MSGRRAMVLGLVMLSAACVVAALAILAISFDREVPDSWGFRGFTVIFAVTFTWVGAALTWRRSNNAVGWLLLAFGAIAATQAALAEYSLFGVVGRSEPLAGAVFSAWVVSWIWVFDVTLVVVFLLLLFPDGRFLSPRWRAVAWLGGLSALATAAAAAFNAGPLNNAPYVENPFPLFDDPGFTRLYLFMIGIAVAAAGAAASLFVRYRRSRGIERQQLKWLAFEAIVLAIAVIVGSFLQGQKLAQVFLIVVLGIFPLVIGVAVLRYRLYDIDAVINRAIVYGATSAAIGAAFFGGIVVLQAVLRPLTGGSEIAVAISTLASFALFQPLQRRMQVTVDRRFYRSRYDAARILDDFSVRLRDQVALDAVRADLLEAVRETVQPAHASVWLREVR